MSGTDAHGTSPRRILLDECIPHRLRRSLPGHEVRSVQAPGWAGTKNGALLRLAGAEGFAVSPSVNRNLEYQQHVPGLGPAVVALRARSNDIDDLAPLMPTVLALQPTLQSGHVVRVPAERPGQRRVQAAGRHRRMQRADGTGWCHPMPDPGRWAATCR